jgi:FkbM family methyltransferase
VVAGFRVHYLHEEEFRLLADDIFGHEQYRFDARTSRPRILDCGAHIGLSVLYFKRTCPRARITAFEPNPDTFELLKRNVWGNGFRDVELVNAAVGESAGTIDFHVSRDPLFWHWGDAAVKNLWYDETRWQTIQVPAVALADWLTEPVDYLKMDIEGFETRVLRTAGERLRQVYQVTVEFHGSKTNPGNRLEAVRAMLQDFGGLTTVTRQGHWLTRESDLNRQEPYTVLVNGHSSMVALAWWLRRDLFDHVRLKLCGPVPRISALTE